MTLLFALIAIANAEEPASPGTSPPPAAPTEPAPPADPPKPPPPADESGWIELSVPVDFASAVDQPKSISDASEGKILESMLSLPTAGLQLRGRWAIRPWLGVTGLGGQTGGYGGTLGAQFGHQWWSLREHTVRPAGETRIRGLLFYGGVSGAQLDVDSTAGVWFGPVGVMAGPALRLDRLHWHGDANLPTALSLGPEGRLAVQIGPVTPWAAVTPSWILVGSRSGVRDAPWSELTVEAGVAFDTHPVALRLSGARTSTIVGPTWEAALGFQLNVL